jgi:hypothetical protein
MVETVELPVATRRVVVVALVAIRVLVEQVARLPTAPAAVVVAELMAGTIARVDPPHQVAGWVSWDRAPTALAAAREAADLEEDLVRPMEL